MAEYSINNQVKSVRRIVPMIYAYTTPEIARHNGWTKIGYTEQDVSKRLAQQMHTADVEYHEEWKGNAVFDDGSGDSFTDHDFHAYLTNKRGVERKPGTEWFRITGPASRSEFNDFRQNRGILTEATSIQYTLRNEQEQAVSRTLDYMRLHENGEFLWNAKPRFGKTLTAYDFCKRADAHTVLIVTNRPAIANSWYSDYVKFLGPESGYKFVSNVSALEGQPYVCSREEYVKQMLSSSDDVRCIEFVSLQDLKGSRYFGGQYDKLREVSNARDSKGNRVGIEWDVLIIDEAHEGVDTYKTDVAFDHIDRKFTLHLSGTPFKALANDKFAADAIYNWTYADEQTAKREWNDEDAANPYGTLPQLNLFTYQMSQVIADLLDAGTEINGETEEYAFDLNEFFAVENGRFKHNEAVDKFLDSMVTAEKYPFSTPELRDKLKHTFWLLNRVDSARMLARKLAKHPVFKDYCIVLAAGDGRLDDDDENKKSFDKVVEAISKYDKTITLSVGQLTTGVTIPEWTAVLMLSNVKSPALYMQAAFRAQNPCLFHDKDGGYYRKENAYVFDFDPARTLTIFEEFANDLNAETSDGRGDTDTRKQNVRTLLNFFPVIGEDDEGRMVELDAEKVLSIPRKIRAREVVKRGFMSDFLFQNISHVFHAPAAVLDIIKKLTPEKEPNKPLNIDPSTAEELCLNEEGEIELPEEVVIGRSREVFGDKLFSDISERMGDVIREARLDYGANQSDEDAWFDQIKKEFKENAVAPMIETAKQSYQDALRPSDQKRLERKLNSDCDRELDRKFDDYKIQRKTLEQERDAAIEDSKTEADAAAVRAEFEAKQAEIAETLKQSLADSVDQLVQSAGQDVVRTVDTSKKERDKRTAEDGIKDHLRGFSRTIPSFLMGYGDDETTLATFDRIVPNEVFVDVTGITLELFRILRDGGDLPNPETGKMEHFEGHIFDQVVFDDSVKEFMRLRSELADYFDESHTEDIFNYIPPQKTNQIYTPKWVVSKMADMLEEENPGCFDDPDKTFADLYMKSGLYIAEIVKRLYRSERMKELYPDDEERLRHIFTRQVFGAAPTEIIYRIATHYILGFAEDVPADIGCHFVCADTAELAKNGNLEAFVQEAFGDMLR